ncbi:hypothetical protein C8Q79DRAFT_493155 [Trametes meyenii]|nr:hypothetical protein C8Q79DRAFT_493155 [Trametes meyenii]
MAHETQFNDLNTDILSYLARYFLLRETIILHKYYLPSFLDFIRPRAKQQLAPYLRRLQIQEFYSPGEHGPGLPAGWPSISDSDTLLAFINILRLASHLESLSMASPRAISTELTPEALQHGLAHPRNLVEIVLHTFPPEYHDVLADVGSNLRTVQFGPDNINHCAEEHLDSFPFLQHHRATLTSLRLSSVPLDSDTLPFPRVRKLKTLVSAWLPDNELSWIAPFATLFPHVEELDLLGALVPDSHSLRISLLSNTHVMPPFVERWREHAGVWQTQHRTWEAGLRYLRVRLPRHAYYLGLTCPAARVDIYTIVREPHLIEPFIQSEVRPRSLRFSVWSEGDFVYGMPIVLNAVSRTCTVTHLMVDITPRSFAPGLRTFEEFLTQLSQLLGSSSLSHLLISVRNPPDSWVYSWGNFVSYDTTTDAPNISNDAQCYCAQDWVPGLTRAIPALRCILFDVDPHGLSAWQRMEPTEAEPIRWEEMSMCQALELMKAEDMEDRPLFS